MTKLSGHQRKRWQVTIKLPSRGVDKNHRPVDLEQTEFIYQTLGHSPGVAINRAIVQLRHEPSLKFVVLRDLFVATKYLGAYTKAMEALETGAQLETMSKWRCPNCQSDLGLTGASSCASCGVVIVPGGDEP